MTLPLGIDVSQAQGQINFSLVATHQEKIRFIGIRTGISWGYQDKWFPANWAESARIGAYRVPYHVVYFGEDPVRQMDNMLKIAATANWSHDRPCLDLELEGGFSMATITSTTRRCMELLMQRTGQRPILYSRASWVNLHLNVNDLPDADWWLAGYLAPRLYPLFTPEMPPPPILPNGVSTWKFHQTCSRANGKAVGMQSYYLDLDRFNGSEQELDEYFGTALVEVPPQTTIEDQVRELRREVDVLNDEVAKLILISHSHAA